jgi:hypothetical protein
MVVYSSTAGGGSTTERDLVDDRWRIYGGEQQRSGRRQELEREMILNKILLFCCVTHGKKKEI